jgi:hypothetical protein
MMKSRFSRCLLTLVLGVTGCSPMRYSQYTGKNTLWLVGPGTMTETSYALPVYRGWPERTYKVIGSIRFVDAWKYWDDGVIRMAASMGRKKGADAIVIRHGAEFGVGVIAGIREASTTYAPNQTTALAIQWLTAGEIQKQKEEEEQAFKQYRTEHPELRVNAEVEDIAYQYFRQESGGTARPNEIANQLADLFEKMSRRAANDLSGIWVFKGTYTITSATSSGDEEPLLGRATVKLDGDNIVIVSNAGKVEINFNGTHTKGRLSGQLGLGSVSAKCDGAALDNKISLSFQSLTPDGTVRGNLVFQR